MFIKLYEIYLWHQLSLHKWTTAVRCWSWWPLWTQMDSSLNSLLHNKLVTNYALEKFLNGSNPYASTYIHTFNS